MHTHTHKHAVCTIKSPAAHHVSFLYAVLFYFGSNQKIHCCHSKCLCTSLSFSSVLGCSEYDRRCERASEWVFVLHFSTFLFMQSVKCLYGFHSLFFLHCSIKMIPFRTLLAPILEFSTSLRLFLFDFIVTTLAVQGFRSSPFYHWRFSCFWFRKCCNKPVWVGQVRLLFSIFFLLFLLSMWWHFSSFDYSHALLAL